MIGYILVGCAFVLIVCVWMKLSDAFRLFRVTLPVTDDLVVESLPTVSLCIPARDETHAMTDCLEAALSSTYPKLEIIVLDDGSRDDTGHLIKSFAHSGIRFVEGSVLPSGWLGKNHALDGLLNEASGEIILFADVDTRLSPQSISQLVGYMKTEQADMVSVLPYRKNVFRASALCATLRHLWTIIGHSKKKPAVASNAWMIKKSIMSERFKGFSTISNHVRPEQTIARLLSGNKTYRFIISNSRLGISYEKKLPSQYETSIRIYYPDFGLGGIVLRIAAIIIVLCPYLFILVSLVTNSTSLLAFSCTVIVIISLVNAWYLGVLRSRSYGLASLLLPLILLREMYLLSASYVLYKSGRVTWKNRPVKTT